MTAANIKMTEPESTPLLEPLTCKRKLAQIQVAGSTVGELIAARWGMIFEKNPAFNSKKLTVAGDFWPSAALIEALSSQSTDFYVTAETAVVATLSDSGEKTPGAVMVAHDQKSFRIRYPWHILSINEDCLSLITKNMILGTVRENVTNDGILVLGKNSVILPGVYMEGVVVIGENCKIGPNCYIRGSTYIGDNCHVGQAVEIKNSVLMNNVAAGHLSYIGDSVISPKTNFGAGTICSNFRHDGKNHRSMAGDELVDTGRRKFGTIMGDNVHTGIHTSIYPGRKIWADMSTLPGDIVKYDIK